MKKFIGERRCGKTTRLIELSAKEQIPILTRSAGDAKCIKIDAQRMGLKIPEPISILQLIIDGNHENIDDIPKIIVDDTEYILKVLLERFNVQSVEAIALCIDNDMGDEVINVNMHDIKNN